MIQSAQQLRDQTLPGDLQVKINKKKVVIKHSLISLRFPFICLSYVFLLKELYLRSRLSYKLKLNTPVSINKTNILQNV